MKETTFSTIATEWIKTWAYNPENVSYKTARQYEAYAFRATQFWGDKDVRTFKTKHVQAFLNAQTHLKPKSKNTVNACLKSLFQWMVREDIITQQDLPIFPVVKFKLGRRKTVSKEVQGEILNEIHRQTFGLNPKIHLGISWLATYVCLRPGDLFRIRERDVDRRNRVVNIRDPKCAEPYEMALTDRDVDVLLQVPAGPPEAPFFRHPNGQPFSHSYFYCHWKRACASLGIEGVDLYGGTRHSSVQAMRKRLTPEQIKQATLHRTNEAFERYYVVDSDDLRAMYEVSQQP